MKVEEDNVFTKNIVYQEVINNVSKYITCDIENIIDI